MQQSNSRFKTSKVINQLKYEEVSSFKKGQKSSLKKGSGRFGKSIEKESQKVMFRDSIISKNKSIIKKGIIIKKINNNN